MEIIYELDKNTTLFGNVILDVQDSLDLSASVTKKQVSGYRVLDFNVQAFIYNAWADVTNALEKSHLEDLKRAFLIYADLKHSRDIEEEFKNPFGEKDKDHE